MTRAISLGLQASPLIPGLSYEVVGVFTQQGAQVFEKAKIIKLFLRATAIFPQHPLESGSSASDHVIFKPREVELPMLITSRGLLPLGDNIKEIYSEIYQLFTSKTLLTVQTKTTSLNNMLISEMPHEESAETLDAVLMSLKLEEFNFVTAVETTAQSQTPKDAKNQATIDRGNQQPIPATPTQTGKTTTAIDFFAKPIGV